VVASIPSNFAVAAHWPMALTTKSLPVRVAQNTVEGGTAWGGGNVQLRINKNTGGTVLCTAGHVLLPHMEGRVLQKPVLPTTVQVGGTQSTPIEKLFPNPSSVRLLEVLGLGGTPLDLIRVGVGSDLKAYFNDMAQRQPSQAVLKAALKKTGATWEVTTASRPSSFDAKRPAAPGLSQQEDNSRNTAKYKIKMTALPLQAKDLQQDAKALGMSFFTRTPDTWLAIQPIGGDTNNPTSAYPGYFLINQGVSGSETQPSGITAMDAGNVIAGYDKRNGGWTRATIGRLVDKNQALRSALQTAYPKLSVEQLKDRLYEHGFTAVSFITKEIAAANLRAVRGRSVLMGTP
jgi:hypothetical protein